MAYCAYSLLRYCSPFIGALFAKIGCNCSKQDCRGWRVADRVDRSSHALYFDWPISLGIRRHRNPEFSAGALSACGPAAGLGTRKPRQLRLGHCSSASQLKGHCGSQALGLSHQGIRQFRTGRGPGGHTDGGRPHPPSPEHGHARQPGDKTQPANA
jgi:hypothetical protein